MSHSIRLLLLSISAGALLVIGCAAPARAQAARPASGSSGSQSDDTRPATTTFLGDTGLWYVPTAEVLPAGKWSASFYRRGTDYLQGHTNVADFAATFAVGLKRAEVFGSFLVDTRIDRDALPVFFNNAAQGGVVDRNPRVNQPWTGNSRGDLYVGAKVNILSQSRGDGVALAVRGTLKLPTGKAAAGVSTGKTDGMLDVVASAELARAIEVSGMVGGAFLGNPDGFQIPTRAFTWGAGAAFPSRGHLRLFTELNGSTPTTNTATITSASLAGVDLSLPPSVSTTKAQTRGTIGLTYQADGFFFGTGLSLSLPRRDPLATISGGPANWDWQVRLGFHPGLRKQSPPSQAAAMPSPIPTTAPAPAIVQAPEHTLTVSAKCDSCAVDVGKTSIVTALAQDSTGCAVTYGWTTPVGALANAARPSTVWTAPGREQTVPVTVTATCPTDNKTASDLVNIRVNALPAKTYAFEDVYFDLDSFQLRPDAMQALDVAVKAMHEDATLSLTIQGYACDIGTPAYNVALGTRRATAVREYLVSRGVPVDRLDIVSFGDTRAKYENAGEATRRLNRRVSLVVAPQP